MEKIEMEDSMILREPVTLTYLLLVMMGLAAFFVTLQRRGVSQGMYRSFFLLWGLAAIGIAAVPNGWLQAFLALTLFALMRDPMMGAHLSRALPLYVMVLAGALISERFDRDLLWLTLSLPVIVGLILAGHVYLNAIEQWGRRDISLHAGQENVNNTQSIAVIATASAIGLAIWHTPWWWLAVLVVASPIVLIQYLDWTMHHTVTMGPVVLLGIALGSLPLVIGWWSLWLVPVLMIGLIWSVGQAMRYEKWWDSGRIRCWYLMLLAGWWHGGWKIRILGRGWQSWVGYQDFLIDAAIRNKSKRLMNTTTMLSTAHNEFVQVLFEHGAVGFVLLGSYIATALWQLGHGSGQAKAVYLVSLAMCGVACVLHPWTWTHGTISEVNADHRPEKGGGQTMMYTIGSPALNWLAFLTAILVEVTR